jgi:hypothetical protein
MVEELMRLILSEGQANGGRSSDVWWTGSRLWREMIGIGLGWIFWLSVGQGKGRIIGWFVGV